jgi:hypothetical protein
MLGCPRRWRRYRFYKNYKNTHEYVIIILETSKMLKLEHMKNLGNLFYSMEKKK